MKSLTLTSLSAALLACSLAACNGATPPPPPAAPNAPNAPAVPETAIGRAAQKGIEAAAQKMRTENIVLNGENGISINGRKLGKDASSNLPRAEITSAGDFIIEGKTQDLTADQRTAVLAYRTQLLNVAETGMRIGIKGADIAGKALGGVAQSIFGGDAGRDAFEKKMEAEGKRIEAEAMTLCTMLPNLLAAQDQLAAKLPAFKPYGRMTQADIDDCGKNNGKGMSASQREALQEQIREEVDSGVREAVGGNTSASSAAAVAAGVAAQVSGREAADAAREAGRQARDAARDAAQEARTAGDAFKRANQPCNFKRPIDLKLDMAGVKTVQFRMSSEDIVIDAGSAAPAVTGAACASTQAALDTMKVEQRREGDRLIVTASHTGNFSGISNVNIGPLKITRYSYLRLNATVPENVTVQVVAGSGDIRINNAMRASVDLGSGDAVLNRVRQGAYLKLGSGNIDINGAGSVHVLEIGSGDVNLRDVTGATQVDELGSGDLKLVKNGGDVAIGTIGSGDIELLDIGGNVKVARVGSGDVTARNVKGGLTVDRIGSGDVNHSGVSGPVSIPKGH